MWIIKKCFSQEQKIVSFQNRTHASNSFDHIKGLYSWTVRVIKCSVKRSELMPTIHVTPIIIDNMVWVLKKFVSHLLVSYVSIWLPPGSYLARHIWEKGPHTQSHLVATSLSQEVDAEVALNNCLSHSWEQKLQTCKHVYEYTLGQIQLQTDMSFDLLANKLQVLQSLTCLSEKFITTSWINFFLISDKSNNEPDTLKVAPDSPHQGGGLSLEHHKYKVSLCSKVYDRGSVIHNKIFDKRRAE